MSRRLPLAPRPYEDELLSSWQGRVACRYRMSREALGLSLGLPAALAAPNGFAAADHAPDVEVAAAWAQACRLDPAWIESLALRRRRALDRYVWAFEAGGAFVGFPACPACLDEDAKAGRDQHLRRPWLQVEALLCARHDLPLVEDCERCGAQGFRFVLLEGAARLACRRCGALVHRITADWSDSAAKAVLAALGAAEPDADAMATARLLWSIPRPGMAPRPLMTWLEVRPRSVRGMAWDRNAPLSTAALAWRTATWIGVAQLLDRAGARAVFGPPRFTLEELTAWTRPRPLAPPRQPVRLRPAAAYRAMAERILARPECAAARVGAGRDRLMGRLMREALECG
jgi:hypothetical protein